MVPSEAAGTVMITLASALAGLSAASAKPKSAAEKVRAVSSAVETRLLAAVGGSLTGVTLSVIVLGVASRFLPPLAVPPLSCTWKVKLA